jgi:hypothetical protein
MHSLLLGLLAFLSLLWCLHLAEDTQIKVPHGHAARGRRVEPDDRHHSSSALCPRTYGGGVERASGRESRQRCPTPAHYW